LDFNIRKWLLLEEMLMSHADIITFQECDHFADFFQPAMAAFGYAGHFVPKGDSPCLQFGYYSDGVGIFYKTSVWREATTAEGEIAPPSVAITDDAAAAIEKGSSMSLAAAWEAFAAWSNAVTAYFSPRNAAPAPAPEVSVGPTVNYFTDATGKPEGNVYMILPLVRKATGQKVVVATTHLKAKISQENETRRARQATQLVAAIAVQQQQLPGSVVVVGADFNTDSYDVVEKGTTVKSECVPTVVATGLESAYPLQTSAEDQGGTYTTWKKRGKYEAKHTIDYIWHQGGGKVETIATLDAVSQDQMDDARLPGFRYPSDHLAICAKLVFHQ
jgi:hypothetical protein